MKKIFILFFALLSFYSAYNQNINDIIIKKLENNNPKAAVNIIDSIFSANNNQNYKIFYLKAISYIELYKTNKKISYLDTAYRNLLISKKLDTQKEINTDINEALIDVASKYVYKGVNEFNSGNYNKALKAFENSIKINNMPAIMQIDTIIIYNTALAAKKLKKYDKAIDYYKKLINFNFGGLPIMLETAQTYLLSGNVDKYLETLKTAENKYGQTREILEEYINFYLTRGDVENIIKYSSLAIDKFPGNSKYYFVKGYAYEQKNMDLQAVREYSTSLQLDSANLNSLYNLAAIYYNKGIEIRKTAKTKDEINKSNNFFTKSMKLLEKYNNLSPNDKQTMELLRSIYKILNFTDKFDDINKKLNNK